MREIIKRIIPNFILNAFRDLRDRIAHQGKYDYKMKRDRDSSLDYTTRYDHKSIRKARKSILWDDDWQGATLATINILNQLKLLEGVGTIVDYGGGIGRISRALLANFQGRVILVDRSTEMRDHARSYIPKKMADDDRIEIWSDTEFMREMAEIEEGVDLILFIEALQHIPEPILDKIFPKFVSFLSPEGQIFVLGNKDLDVDLQARRHHTLIGDFLRKHVEVLREDIWTEWERGGETFRFKHPRFSFLCRKRMSPDETRSM